MGFGRQQALGNRQQAIGIQKPEIRNSEFCILVLSIA
jgi:hypothetical protein